MTDHCEHCPIPDLCPGRPEWCELAATRPPDSTEVRMIVDRSRMAADLPALRGEPVSQPAYPPLAQQGINLVESLWAWAVSGFAMASEAEVARRTAICQSCEHWDAPARRCRICGCSTDVKIRLRTAHCPLSEPKW